MSDAATEETAVEEDGKKGKKAKKEGGGRSNLIPAIILALGILGGGYLMSSGGGGADAAEHPLTTKPPKLGEIAQIEAININLADGRFLRVGIALQLIEGVDKSEFEKGETAKANDLLIDKLGGRSMEELGSTEGRAQIKTELKEELMEIYEGEVVDVYLTDFVMQ